MLSVIPASRRAHQSDVVYMPSTGCIDACTLRPQPSPQQTSPLWQSLSSPRSFDSAGHSILHVPVPRLSHMDML